MIRFFNTKLLIVLSSIIFLFSCNQKNIVKNKPEDLEKAKEYASKFYDYIIKNEQNKNVFLFDNDLKDKVCDIIKKTHEAQGEIKEIEVVKIATINTSEDNKKTIEYNLELKVTYEKGVTKELLGFLEKNNVNVVLTGYFINI